MKIIQMLVMLLICLLMSSCVAQNNMRQQETALDPLRCLYLYGDICILPENVNAMTKGEIKDLLALMGGTQGIPTTSPLVGHLACVTLPNLCGQRLSRDQLKIIFDRQKKKAEEQKVKNDAANDAQMKEIIDRYKQGPTKIIKPKTPAKKKVDAEKKE